MTPGVGRSLTEGFRLASRSWGGIGLVLGAWVAVGLVALLVVIATRPPAALLEEPVAETPAPGAVDPAATPQADEAEDATAATRAAEVEQAQREWFARAWPALLLVAILLMAAGVLIQGGQIGYLVQRLRTGAVGWGDIRRFAAQAFLPLLGAGALSLAVVLGALLLIGLLMVPLGALSGAAVAVIGALAVVALIMAAVWLSVRLALWPLVIVADRQGPVAGLKVAWRATRGRWWTVAGIVAAMFAVSIAFALVSGLAEWVGSLMGPAAGFGVQVLTGLAGLLANFFLSFATTGALLRLHEDLKSPEA